MSRSFSDFLVWVITFKSVAILFSNYFCCWRLEKIRDCVPDTHMCTGDLFRYVCYIFFTFFVVEFLSIKLAYPSCSREHNSNNCLLSQYTILKEEKRNLRFVVEIDTTAKNTVISHNFAQNYAETVPFHKISIPGN